ncbi:MAG: tRNA 4-thiouridine(8) synthase ThiI [Pseudomonadaceae bacterium]|nr:MAG: tRNA 4-thiouridine(8) synthase ThiI [Pseudomonadaceae bacterium]
MKLLIKFFAEITIKTTPVRKRFVKQLKVNLRGLLAEIDPALRVHGSWDSLQIEGVGADNLAATLDCLQRTPGISQIQEVHEYPLTDLPALADLCVQHLGAQLAGKVFAVRCKRIGQHAFSSPEVASYLGRELSERCGAAGISLSAPEVRAEVEIRHDRVLLIQARHAGMGGFPLGTMEPVLSLMSGGFDSTVASYQLLQRGLLPHFIFFNMGGRAHEIGVRQIAHHLWRQYAGSHRLRFISVPFEEVVGELIRNVDDSQMGVVLKRMMLRAADRVAHQLGYQALVTGEAIAQVASQTLPNLAVIDRAVERLVLRPLITTSKQAIITQARHIGVETMCSSIPEYCGVISVSPAIYTTHTRVAEVEAQFDFNVLERAIEHARYTDCNLLDQPLEGIDELQLVSAAQPGQIVIDIRAPDQRELSPLQLDDVAIINIPFYELKAAFAQLDPARVYLLYCDKGLMSQMHAQHLLDAGFGHVRVLRF